MIDLQTVAWIAAILVPLASAIGAVHLARQQSLDAKAIALAADEKASKAVLALAEFKVEAANKYVTAEAVGRIEGLIGEIGRETRSALDDIRNRMLDFFTTAPQRRPPPKA